MWQYSSSCVKYRSLPSLNLLWTSNERENESEGREGTATQQEAVVALSEMSGVKNPLCQVFLGKLPFSFFFVFLFFLIFKEPKTHDLESCCTTLYSAVSEP